MKKLLLFAAFAAFTFTTAKAQSEFRIGFKGELTLLQLAAILPMTMMEERVSI